jgi:hypothetical protein
MTFGVLPSMTATHELVVPRSMPMTLPMVLPLNLRQAGRAASAPEWVCQRLIRRPPDPAPWICDSPHFCGLLAHIGGPPVPASQSLTKSRGVAHKTSSMVIGPLPQREGPVRQTVPTPLESVSTP